MDVRAVEKVSLNKLCNVDEGTLLNMLFGTPFLIMDDTEGRGQTTKGIWMSSDDSGKILIFDIEGCDSKERGDQRMTFEQTTSLFALAVSDVLMINMWMNDIGRHAAANLGLLQVIFEVNLKLFEQSSAKKLMFCIRDFVESGSNREFLTKALKKDIDDIWAKMYKPEKFKDS